MALQIELVAADRVVWSGQASEVIVRTSEGDMGVLEGHIPLLAVLVPSVVEIRPADGETIKAAVGDGFLSVADDRVSILSEDTFLAEDVSVDVVRSELDAAHQAEDLQAVARAEAKLRLVGALN